MHSFLFELNEISLISHHVKKKKFKTVQDIVHSLYFVVVVAFSLLREII